MNKWATSTLDDLKIFIKDGTHGTHKDIPNGIPLLSAKDIENGKILIPKDCRTISEDDYKLIHANYEIENDDILLTIVGTIGRVAIAKDLKRKITFQRSVGIIRFDKNKVNPEYTFHYFQSAAFQQILERSKNASAQGGVYLGALAKAKITHPILLDVQQKISHILSTADAVIEKTQAAIAKFKDIKQGMLHDLFTRGIDLQTGKLRPKYEDAPELYKESKLGWIPKGWDDERLENLCSQKPTYGINAAAVEFGYRLPTYLRITDIDDEGNFSKTGRKCVDSPFSNQYLLKKGDLVFARTGATVGKTYLYKEEDGVLVFAGFLIKVSVNESLLNHHFLKFFTETSSYWNWVSLMSQRSGQPGINGMEYGSLLISTPKTTEQNIIADRLLSIQSKIKTEQDYLLKLQQIKAGLMGDLLSGNKEVKITDKEEVLHG